MAHWKLWKCSSISKELGKGLLPSTANRSVNWYFGGQGEVPLKFEMCTPCDFLTVNSTLKFDGRAVVLKGWSGIWDPFRKFKPWSLFSQSYSLGCDLRSYSHSFMSCIQWGVFPRLLSHSEWEADRRMPWPSIKPDVKEICKMENKAPLLTKSSIWSYSLRKLYYIC